MEFYLPKDWAVAFWIFLLDRYVLFSSMLPLRFIVCERLFSQRLGLRVNARPTEDICCYSFHRKPLFPQDKEGSGSFALHEENRFVFPERILCRLKATKLTKGALRKDAIPETEILVWWQRLNIGWYACYEV